MGLKRVVCKIRRLKIWVFTKAHWIDGTEIAIKRVHM